MVACFWLLSLNSFSQSNHTIDSLHEVVKNSAGVRRFDALIALVREVASHDYNEALRRAVEAKELAYSIGDSARIVTSGRIEGQLLNRLDRSREAAEVLTKVLPMANRNGFREEYKIILNNLALAYTIQAEYDKALDINFQTLRLREEDNDKRSISISLNNIGLVYYRLKNFEKALEFYNRSLELKRQARDDYDLDQLLINIGLCYNQLRLYNQAQAYFLKALQECGGENCRSQTKLEGEFGLGVSNYNLAKYPEATGHFKESYRIATGIGNKRFQAENLIYLARVYDDQKQNDLAINALAEAESIAMKSGYNEILIEIYKKFSAVFRRQELYEKASFYQNKYITLKDSVYSEELIDNIARIQTNYAERENLATIAAKNQIISLQRSLIMAIVVITLLATSLVVVLYHSVKVKRKVNADLSDAKAIIEEQNRQLMSSNVSLNEELKEKNIDLQRANDSLQRVNEELDNFIYKTSHDIRGPLASLKGMCNVALMDVKDPLALSYLRKLDITAEKLNTILTRLLIVNQINNSTLGAVPIDFEGIVDDILTLERKKGLPSRLVILKDICENIGFQSDKEFVRIILENLIDNAIKFYNDSDRVEPFVKISIHGVDDYVSIHVVDNGIGISQVHPDKIFQMFSRASERSETGGIGLFITKTAAEKLGGTVHLKTTPEGHTEFYVKLPLVPSRVLA